VNSANFLVTFDAISFENCSCFQLLIADVINLRENRSKQQREAELSLCLLSGRRLCCSTGFQLIFVRRGLRVVASKELVCTFKNYFKGLCATKITAVVEYLVVSRVFRFKIFECRFSYWDEEALLVRYGIPLESSVFLCDLNNLIGPCCEESKRLES